MQTPDSLATSFAATTSVYQHLRRHVHPEVTGLLPGGESLPDDEVFWAAKNLRWVAGGLDGVSRHNARSSDSDGRSARAMAHLLMAAESPRPEHLAALNDFLKEAPALDYIDELLREVAVARSTDRRAPLTNVARWLAISSPDREPVKVGIAVLGVLSGDDESDLLLTLGRHDEFTVYAAVALTHLYEFPDVLLMELGRHAGGWGRIQVIERLRHSTNPEVKAWMLRQGFRNNVMNEYTAYVCAVAGDLAGQLAQPEIDDELFDAATDLLHALLTGGPAEDIDDYDDGAVVVREYLRHLRSRQLMLGSLRVLELLRLRSSRI